MGFLGDLIKGIGGAVPVAGPLISAGLGALQGREENRASQDAANLYNQFWGPGGTREQGANALVDRLTAAGFDPFGPQTSSRTGTTFGTTAQDSTTRSNERLRQIVDAAQARGKGKVEALMEGRLGQGRTEAEKIAQLVNINNQMRGAAQAAADKAGIRGLGAMGRAGMMAGPEQQAAAARIAYLDPAKDLERNRQAEADFMGLMEQWKGQDRSGVSRTTGTSTSTGGSTGTTTGGPDMGMLANLFLPQSPMATTQTGQNPWLNAAQDATTALTGLWGGRPTPTTPPIQQLPAARNYTNSVFGGQ